MKERSARIKACKSVLSDFSAALFFHSDKHVLARGKLSEDLRGVGISLEELQTCFYGVPNNRAIEYLFQRSYPEEGLSVYSERKEASFCLHRWFDQDRIAWDDGRFAKKVDMFCFTANVISVSVEEGLIFEDMN